MTRSRKNYLVSTVAICLLVLIFNLVTSGCASTKAGSTPIEMKDEKTTASIGDREIKTMIEKAVPLIEEETEMKFKHRMEYQIVKRDVVRDVLTQEMLPQLKKLLDGADDDMLTRQAEITAQMTSQSLLGKYSFLKKEFYIIPDNVKTVARMLEIEDDQLEDFVFLIVTHELVHALDDQHFEIWENLKSKDTVEIAGAFNSLMEGHAVYVTNRIADQLEISETSQQLSVKSAAGIQGEGNRQQQQIFHSIYVKGAEFVEAIIEEKGPVGIATAFTSPPVSTRQIMNPDEYLNPSAIAGLDCIKLLQKVSGQLPTDGMNTQTIDIGSMVLRAMLVSKGISESEAVTIADNCLSGGLVAAAKQGLKPSSASVLILNFNNGEAVSKFDEMTQRIEKYDLDQFNAKLNTSYNLIKEEDLELDGYDMVRYRHSEKKIDDDVTTNIFSAAIIDNIYVEVGFKNMKEVTEEDMLDILNLIYNEQSKMKQEREMTSLQ